MLPKTSPHLVDRISLYRANDSVQPQIAMLSGTQEPLLATVKRGKLVQYGHVARHDTLSKTCRAPWREEGAEANRGKAGQTA